MGRLWYRLKWIVKVPFRRRSTLIVTSALTYLSLFNAFSWYMKDEGAPINRFHWRLLKAEGKLSEEMLHKERMINEYYDAKMKSVSDFSSWSWK
ncbi:hypothetical protein PFISCL1PPCAC_6057 [Pristionchus fissidentatus]|uniref:Uncharacterized protein n=1 Tax=Pristionchus fissidentatus TaxID=1538716 RepID=A0AAV5VA45_9BILA|nr:hypothetical protein PFISCL1PPCAC_6057 [Pristionchus fissidentatus]